MYSDVIPFHWGRHFRHPLRSAQGVGEAQNEETRTEEPSKRYSPAAACAHAERAGVAGAPAPPHTVHPLSPPPPTSLVPPYLNHPHTRFTPRSSALTVTHRPLVQSPTPPRTGILLSRVSYTVAIHITAIAHFLALLLLPVSQRTLFLIPGTWMWRPASMGASIGFLFIIAYGFVSM